MRDKDSKILQSEWIMLSKTFSYLYRALYLTLFLHLRINKTFLLQKARKPP